MPNCPKCGAKVTEGMNFCANCGAALKPTTPAVQEAAPTTPAPAPAPAPAQPSRPEKYEKHEKREKGEKHEKTEKTEKYEKREAGYVGPIIGGTILIALGLFFYLMMTMRTDQGRMWAYFFIIIGIVIIIAGAYAAATASRRHPPT